MNRNADAPARRVTIKDVAVEAGVSPALVSLVIRNAPNVSDSRRAAVHEAIERLGYRPNRLASRLASRRTRTVGLLMLDVRNPVFADISDGVDQVITPSGNHLLIAKGSLGPDSEQAAISSFVDIRVDGILLAGYMGTPESLSSTVGGIPTVMMTRRLDLSRVDSVTGGDEAGAQIAVEHLVQLGHRRIGHISSPLGVPYPARRAGYLAAMAGHGLTPEVYEGDLGEQGGRDGVEHFARSADGVPSAIFCYNDLTAFGALEALDRRGLRVPEEVAVVGYDNTGMGAFPRIGLTSMDQHAHRIGIRAAELLLERIEDPQLPARTVELEPTLMVRRSSGPRLP